ncbi:dihydroxy-acid and 6-phosphogluconate dehydratase [Xylariomycetidae sp. FL2044]|nr:dihydroxy-acid and 6-phosphogluconate dehydratase [Xylariomycetidae sp. FL2044]
MDFNNNTNNNPFTDKGKGKGKAVANNITTNPRISVNDQTAAAVVPQTPSVRPTTTTTTTSTPTPIPTITFGPFHEHEPCEPHGHRMCGDCALAGSCTTGGSPSSPSPSPSAATASHMTMMAPLVDIEDYKAETSQQQGQQGQQQDDDDEQQKKHGDQQEEQSEELKKQKKKQEEDNKKKPKGLRSAAWFDRSENLGMRALYVERYLNYGLTAGELLSGKPIVGIAQTGSDIAPCNRHHLELAKRVRDGIRAAGAIPFEFPVHPIQESSRRPTAALDRNLAYLGLVELLHAYPFDGVVLLTGCDKTTPACLMAAATVNIPAICLNVGPMLNGWSRGGRVGSGSVVWQAREMHGAGQITDTEMVDMVANGTPSPGHCNTLGTASTMNAIAEALGMALPGSSAIPAVYRERSQCAYDTGVQIVEMIHNDRKPCDILTREAFENAIVACTAIGGSTNAPIHLNALARHTGVPLDLDDWDSLGYPVPLILNVQPAGEMLCEEYHRAGGLPAVLAELSAGGYLPHPDVLTANGKTMAENIQGKATWDRKTIFPFDNPLKSNAGFVHLKGNLFDSAIMKLSVISKSFSEKYLENPDDLNAFECPVAVFDGPEDFHARLETAPIEERTLMVMRGVGPLGYPGSAEVVNMHAPSWLLKLGVRDLPCMGDGRQSGTSGSPSILNATPEAADGGNLALLRDGDVVRVDLTERSVNVKLSREELVARRAALEAQGGYSFPPSQTPWQDIYRREVNGLSDGGVLKRATEFKRIAQVHPVPRDNH